MITKTITYIDHNQVQRTDILNFHISEAVLSENLGMIDTFEKFIKQVGGPTKILSTEETQEMLDLLKWYIRVSYGVRTPDGRFDQDEPAGSGPIWKHFRSTNGFNDFLMGLFRPDPMKAVEFMAAVSPETGTLTDEQIATMSPDMQKLIKDARDQADPEPPRLPPGTRIVDDVPIAPDGRPLSVVPDQLDEIPKTPIPQSQYDQMKASLRPEQFEQFMSTRYVE